MMKILSRQETREMFGVPRKYEATSTYKCLEKLTNDMNKIFEKVVYEKIIMHTIYMAADMAGEVVDVMEIQCSTCGCGKNENPLCSNSYHIS